MSGFNFETWAIELTADIKNFTKNIKSAEKTMSDFAKSSSKMSDQISKSLNSKGYSKLGKDIVNTNKEIIRSNGDVVRSFKNHSSTTSMAAAGFKGLTRTLLKFLSVYKLIGFMKDSITLGSDIVEVQHVVDTTFPKMKDRVNEFAKAAIEGFGMSELSAKEYTGTMGAMLKSMGLTEQASAGMSMDMVRLAGDMASFFNLKPEVAFNKIRSGIAGQVMPLKQLGINMNIANLEAYAMANGIEKSYREMSQAEQALLRYQYLVSVTGDMQGDFAKTSDTWANQTKILTERFKQLKAVLGQGLIMALHPVLKMINNLMVKLIDLANIFTIFVGKLTGKSAKDISQAMGTVQEDIGDVDTGYSDMADSVAKGAEKSANKAVKKAQKAKKTMLSVMGFDKLNKLSDPDKGDKSKDDLPKNDISKKLAGLNAGIGSLAMDGLEAPEIDTSKYEESANRLYLATKKVAERIRETLGKIRGFWEEHKGTIIPIVAGLATGIGIIFGKLKFDKYAKLAQGISTALKTALAPISGTTIVIAVAAALLVATIVDLWNKSETFRKSVKETWELLKKTVTDVIDGIKEEFQKFSDEYGSQIVDGLKKAWETWTQVFESAWQNVIKPILDFLIKGFGILWKNVLQPFLGLALKLFGELMTILLDLWNKVIGPLFELLLTILGTVLKPILDVVLFFVDILTAWLKPALELIGEAFGWVGDIVRGLIDKLGGFIDIALEITQDISAAFSLVWEGIKIIFSGVGDWFKEKFDGAANAIREAFSGIGEWFGGIWGSIKSFFSGAGEWFGEKFRGAVNGIKNAFSGIGEWFGGIWNSILSVFKSGGKIFEGIKEGVADVFKSAVNWILKGVNAVISAPFNAINGMLNKIRDIKIPVVGKVFSGLWPADPIKAPQIPLLATGGTVGAGQLFIARENGPELIGGGNGRSSVMNNDQIVAAVSAGVADAVMQVMMNFNQDKNGGGSDNRTIVLQVDGEKLGEAAVNGINKRNSRYRTRMAIT